MKLLKNPLIFISLIVICAVACKKEETAIPPVQNISLTDYNAISNLLILKSGQKVNSAIIDTIQNSNLVVLDDSYPGSKLNFIVVYSNDDTLENYALEITGVTQHWTAFIDSTTFSDSLKIAHISFDIPNSLKPGILNFKYYLFKNEFIKTEIIKAKVEVLEFINSGGTIII